MTNTYIEEFEKEWPIIHGSTQDEQLNGLREKVKAFILKVRSEAIADEKKRLLDELLSEVKAKEKEQTEHYENISGARTQSYNQALEHVKDIINHRYVD